MYINIRACKHDYLILQKQWDIATMDMTLDLAVLGIFLFIFLLMPYIWLICILCVEIGFCNSSGCNLIK